MRDLGSSSAAGLGRLRKRTISWEGEEMIIFLRDDLRLRVGVNGANIEFLN